MPFLSVLFAYLLSRHTTVGTWLHRDRWLYALLDSQLRSSPFAALGIPLGGAILTALLLWKLPFWLGFAAGILVLLFSIGRENCRGYVLQTLSQLRDGNAESIWLALESAGLINDKSGNRDSGSELWAGLRSRAAYVYLTDLFAVFFWFCLLGPAGAVLFRLLSISNGRVQRLLDNDSPGNTGTIKHWLMAMEWLPARYMGLCFCLAGNFTSGFSVWRQLAPDTHLPTAGFLGRCVDAALLHDLEVAPTAAAPTELALALQRAPALHDLLARTEMIGLVGLALAVLLL